MEKETKKEKNDFLVLLFNTKFCLLSIRFILGWASRVISLMLAERDYVKEQNDIIFVY